MSIPKNNINKYQHVCIVRQRIIHWKNGTMIELLRWKQNIEKHS